MLELDDLKQLHDKAYNHGQTTRERAADDQVFYWVTQWDDSLLGDSSLSYRGEFNVLRKAGRQIIADLRSNPIQIDFSPKADTRDDGADLLDGLYLSDDRVNTTLESYDNAVGEAVVCGVGAWELYTEYESNRAGNENQVIRRRPIYEANNNCFWDPNAKRLDKSDTSYVSILTAYSEDGYKELVHELTGEKIDEINTSNFKSPEHSYTFPWVTNGNALFYVSSFYHREKVKDKVFTMVDPFGQPLMLRESDLTEIMDELIDEGYEIKDTRVIERWQITKYIASGEEILKTDVIAGENIPVIPTYGERAFVEGEEHYEGVTRLAKDPQRLRNFQMSYLADVVSRSPRPKPIFFPEQIQKYEFMYEENGADNNYPYLYQNMKTLNGEPLPIGPVAQMPEQNVPQALMMGLELTRQAVEDVANPGLPQDLADTDLSGKAVTALQNRLDQQSIVYQQNLKHAKRRDAEIYASMAADVYDAPRKVTLTLPDGTRKTEELMGSMIDRETGEQVILNDLTNMEFDVYADIGPTYASKKEQTIEQLNNMAVSVAQTDPNLHKLIILKIATLQDGVASNDIRDYANKQLILAGFKEPETDEDKQMLQEASQQQQEPDAMMIAAQAEQAKAEASMAREQRQAQADQAKNQLDQMSNQIDVFKAQTDRAKVEVEAQVAGANIQFTTVKTEGQKIDNVLNMTQPFRARADEDRKELKEQSAGHDFEFDPATGKMTNARN